jgi:hypothetical protein
MANYAITFLTDDHRILGIQKNYSVSFDILAVMTAHTSCIFTHGMGWKAFIQEELFFCGATHRLSFMFMERL